MERLTTVLVVYVAYGSATRAGVRSSGENIKTSVGDAVVTSPYGLAPGDS